MDLEFLLGVISDGPCKSYSFRRLRYLESRFSMYQLLNEYQELMQQKVGGLFLCGGFVSPMPLIASAVFIFVSPQYSWCRTEIFTTCEKLIRMSTTARA
jgi:hypothetical protein